MALQYLSLTNDVLQRLNEVPLTSGNFSSAIGVYADVKNAVNSALNKVNRQAFEWPFNHNTYTETLVVDQVKYPYQNDTKSVSFDTFRLKGSVALNTQSQKLEVLDYEEYLERFSDYEVFPEEHHSKPKFVVRNRDLSYTIVPPPDQEYEVKYEYYSFPEDLINWDDETNLPNSFRWTLLEGALYHTFMFRGDIEGAAAADKLFREGIENLRTLYINRYEYVRSAIRG